MVPVSNLGSPLREAIIKQGSEGTERLDGVLERRG